MSNLHCGKHDKIYDEKDSCPGCDAEKLAEHLLGPDDTLAEQRGTLPKKPFGRKHTAEE